MSLRAGRSLSRNNIQRKALRLVLFGLFIGLIGALSSFAVPGTVHAGGSGGSGGGGGGGCGVGPCTSDGWTWAKFSVTDEGPSYTFGNGTNLSNGSTTWSKIQTQCSVDGATTIYAFVISDNTGATGIYNFTPGLSTASGGPQITSSPVDADGTGTATSDSNAYNNFVTFQTGFPSQASGLTWDSNVGWFCSNFTKTPQTPQGTITLKCSPDGYVVSGYDPDNAGAAVNYQIRYDSSSGGVKDSGTTYKGDNTFHSDTFTFGRTYVLMIQDDVGTYDQVGQSIGPNCPGSPPAAPVVYPSCNLTTAFDPGSITYQTPSANPSYTPPGYAANSNTWSTMNIGSTVTSQTVVTITDKSVTTGATDTLVPSTTLGTGRGEGTNGYWSYVPQETEVIVSVNHEEYALTHETYPGHTKVWEWTTYSTAGSQDFICYQASCTLLSVTGTGPGGAVIEGQPYTAWAQLNNTGIAPLPSSLEGDPLSITNGTSSPPDANVGEQVNVGSSSPPIEISGTAPSGGPTNINIGYPDYYGDGNIFNSEGFGTPCTYPDSSPNTQVYAPFSLTPYAQVTLENAAGMITYEDPTQAVNTTYVTESGSPVSENVTSNLTYTTTACGSSTEASTSNGGPFNPGTTTYLYNNYSYPVCVPLHAGDQYCAEIDVPDTTVGSNQAYVGPGGDIIGGADDNQTVCATVINRPFFKVKNGGVEAGGNYPSAGSCTGGGTLGSWNDDSGVYPDYGAGSQLNALALGNIVGFSSDNNSPETLNFANTVNNVATGTDGAAYSQYMGGQFGGGHCITTLGPGGGTTTTLTPNQQICPGTINPGTNETYYVPSGNVYIACNVTYNTAGWNINAGPTFSTNIPSFTLIVQSGNIFIDPGVTQLDGIYTAQSTGGTGGTIYTCGSGVGTPTEFTAPMAGTQLYTNCYNQLTVNGTFVAKQIDLQRTFGSLRDEQSPYFNMCSGYVSLPPIGNTCAAEVFNLSPELYLSSPDVAPPSGGAQDYDAESSLPPVL